MYLRSAVPFGPAHEQVLPNAPTTLAASQVVNYLAEQIPAGDSVVVLPEGVMLNYITRHPAGIPYSNYMPPEVLLYGERRILEAFRATPPDWLIIAPKSFQDYFPVPAGHPPVQFGRGYLDELVRWIQTEYHPVTALRDPSGYAITVLKKGPPPAQ